MLRNLECGCSAVRAGSNACIFQPGSPCLRLIQFCLASHCRPVMRFHPSSHMLASSTLVQQSRTPARNQRAWRAWALILVYSVVCQQILIQFQSCCCMYFALSSCLMTGSGIPCSLSLDGDNVALPPAAPLAADARSMFMSQAEHGK